MLTYFFFARKQKGRKMEASKFLCSKVENKIRRNNIYTTKSQKFFELKFCQAFILLGNI